jgi:hypothetical protein
MSEQEWQAWAEGDDPDTPPPGMDPFPPEDFGPLSEKRRPAARVTASTRLNLRGTEPPTIELAWNAVAGTVTLLFRGNNINQFLGFDGTPQEVRQALTKGLERLDQAVADHVNDPP